MAADPLSAAARLSETIEEARAWIRRPSSAPAMSARLLYCVCWIVSAGPGSGTVTISWP